MTPAHHFAMFQVWRVQGCVCCQANAAWFVPRTKAYLCGACLLVVGQGVAAELAGWLSTAFVVNYPIWGRA